MPLRAQVSKAKGQEVKETSLLKELETPYGMLAMLELGAMDVLMGAETWMYQTFLRELGPAAR